MTSALPASSGLLASHLYSVATSFLNRQMQAWRNVNTQLLTGPVPSSCAYVLVPQLQNLEVGNANMCEFVSKDKRGRKIRFAVKVTTDLLTTKTHRFERLTKQRNILLTIPRAKRPAFCDWWEPTSWLLQICLMCLHRSKRAHTGLSNLLFVRTLILFIKTTSS